MFFPGKPFIDEVILTKDGKKADIYCPLNSGFPLEEDLFHIIRHLFLYAASMKGLYACHSSSILYREKACFFGPLPAPASQLIQIYGRTYTILR